MMDFSFEVPGAFTLVDHALSRVEKGLVGHVVVEGEPTDDGTSIRAARKSAKVPKAAYGGH